MAWIQLSLAAGDLDVEAISACFDAWGALSVSWQDAADQPLFEPPPGATPLWNQTRVTALFAADCALEQLKIDLIARWGPGVVQRLHIECLDDRDWVRAWMEGYAPMQFGQRLWIVPSGFQAPDPAAVNIELDPGLAFGTGTHPTTAMCLEWLDAHPPRDRVVIDYGCGSGILGIAALKLGARAVWAVDNDPQALLATQDNAARNAVADRLQTLLPEQRPLPQADLLLANILANPLIELAARFAALLPPGGELVLSGILASQAEAVRAAYQDTFELAPILQPFLQRADWVRLAARRRGPT